MASGSAGLQGNISFSGIVACFPDFQCQDKEATRLQADRSFCLCHPHYQRCPDDCGIFCQR